LQILLTEPKDSDYNEVKGYRSINGEEADKIGQGAPVGHQQQPPQGFGQPAPIQTTPYPQQPPYQQPAPPAAPAEQLSPDGAWKLVNGAWVPNTPPPPAAPPAAPAWAAPASPAPPAFNPQQPQNGSYGAQPAAGNGTTQNATAAPPTAPAWQPNGQQPAAPAWAPQR
jgi:putative serine protease PepD